MVTNQEEQIAAVINYQLQVLLVLSTKKDLKHILAAYGLHQTSQQLSAKL